MMKTIFRKAATAIVLLLSVTMMAGFTYADLPVEMPVTVEGFEGEIVIEPEDGAPAPEITSKKILGTDSFKWSACEPADYCYKVYQKPGNEKDVIYDTTVYEAQLSVYNLSDTELEYHFYFFTDKGKPDEIKFVNTKPEPEPTETDKTDNKPQTGDDTYEYLALFCVCALSFILIIVLKFKSLRDEGVREDARGGN